MTDAVPGNDPSWPEWVRSSIRSHGSVPPTRRETLDVSQVDGPRDVARLMLDRTRDLESSTADRIVFVEWELAATPRLLRQLLEPRVAGDLLELVRGSARRDGSTVWTVSITPIPSERTVTDWSERDTPTGDFVRELSSQSDAGTWSSGELASLAARLDAKTNEIEELIDADAAPVSSWTPGLLDRVLASLESGQESSR